MEDVKAKEFFSEIIDNKDDRIYNFLINTSNQANLTASNNISPLQLSSVFVVISPYYIDKFNIEGLDVDIKITEDNTVTINNQDYEMVEVKPGIKIFGLCKQNKE